jgi:hypothetical protein
MQTPSGGPAEQIIYTGENSLYGPSPRPIPVGVRVPIGDHNQKTRALKTRKAAVAFADAAFEFNPGGDLRSRVVSSAVSSAQQGLTSVFGMGTGVTLAVRPPGNLGIEIHTSNFDEQLKEVG